MIGDDTDDQLCIGACDIEADPPCAQGMPLSVLRRYQQLADTGAE